MGYRKRALILALGLACLVLNLAAAALGDPVQKMEKAQSARTESDAPESETKPTERVPEVESALGISVPPTGRQLGAQELQAILAPIFKDTGDSGGHVESKQSAKAPAGEKRAKNGAEPNRGFVSRALAATRRLVSRAMSFRGVRYVWGGVSRRGIDCSGLTRLLYSKEGVGLPHSAREQFKLGQPVAREDLLPGDLVFFNTRGPVSHVGIYIGSGKFIHASSRRRGVRVDYLNAPYYTKRYAGARRYKAFG